jgi:hypothetical protein
MFAATKSFFSRVASLLPAPSWVLDFSAGEPWSNGTNYTYRSLRTAGTYVNSSGYIAVNAANVCLQSQNFTNTTTWPTSFLTVTANSGTAPDGTNTAFLLTEQVTGNASHLIGNTNIGLLNQRMTYSCYFKKAASNSRDYAFIGLFYISTTNSDGYVIFDLATGTVALTVPGLWTNVTSSITDVGNGWYRCVATGTPSTGGTLARIRIGPATQTAISYTVMSGQEKSVLAWGAQLVAGSDALPYSLTNTSTNGIPRLTHSSSGTRLGLLVEESRMNIALATENFTDTSRWFVTNATAADTTNTAPDNGADAESITEVAATSGSYRIRSNPITTGVAAGDTFTSSCFIKDAPTNGKGYGYVSVTIDGGTSRTYTVIVNLSTGALETTMTSGSPTGTAYTIENYGNGWYRVSATATAQTGATGVRVLIGMWQSGATDSNGYPTYTVSAGNEKSILAWGAQIEEGATPTSYLENTAVTGSGVTRSADLAHVLDSSITSWGDPGALVIHFYPPGQAGTLLSTDDASTAQVGIEASSKTAARAFWSSGSTSTGTIGSSGVQKAVHYWNGSTSKFCINGGTVQSGTNNLTIGNTDFVTLGAEATDSSNVPGTFSQYANCVIRKVEFYSGTLTDANLQTITT